MAKLVLGVILLLVSSASWAEEIFLNAGVTRDTETNTARLQWSTTYLQEINETAAFSLLYGNEGHQVNHYRDGIGGQLWARGGVWNRRVVFGLGFGPYAYFDTHVGPNDTFHDEHGIAALVSATVTLYALSPFLLQARINYLAARQSFDTVSATFGIGYELTERPREDGRVAEDLHNEITAYGGETTLNSSKNEHSGSWAAEYRRSFGRYVDWTATWLYEGDRRPVARYGVASQLWLGHPFCSDHLTLGAGIGPYLAYDKYPQEGDSKTKVEWDASFTASYRFFEHWGMRFSWSRIITTRDRDTDIFLWGMSYRL